jgi:hypothetical protein
MTSIVHQTASLILTDKISDEKLTLFMSVVNPICEGTKHAEVLVDVNEMCVHELTNSL